MIRSVVPGRARGRVRAPPSKSYTHRALVTAFLSGRSVDVRSPLDSDDTRATAAGLVALGARIRRHRTYWTVGPGRRRHSAATIDCRESGTTLRLLTAVAALQSRPIRFIGRGRLPYRPMEPVFRSLRELGAKIAVERNGPVLPFTIRGPIGTGRVSVSARESSQPASALLLALSSLPGPSEIVLKGPVVSRPYLDATVAWLRYGGQRLTRKGDRLILPEGQGWTARRVEIPGDASSAAYLWASAATSDGSVIVDGIDRRWPQADLAILPVLRRMGVTIADHGKAIRASGAPTRGVVTDLTDSPDLYPLIGALAALTAGATSILSGALHVEYKESDRARETVRLVRALGGRTERANGSLRIDGTDRPRPLDLTDLTDHRLVMSAAVAALGGTDRSRLGDTRAVGKSYPGFWSALDHLTGGRAGR